MTSGKLGRRAFLGAAVAGAAGAAVAACSGPTARGAGASGATPPSRTPRASAPIAENAQPGDPHWEIRQLGAVHEIEGYAGQASVRQGESFPLFVSSTSPGYRVTAYRLGWYQGDGARKVWQSGPLRGHRQNGPTPGRCDEHNPDGLGPRAERADRRLAGGFVPAPAGRGFGPGSATCR